LELQSTPGTGTKARVILPTGALSNEQQAA
jgi:hypothetical protein